MTDPQQQNVPEQTSEEDASFVEDEVVQLRWPEGLRRLREQIGTTVRELERLRRENEALAERVRELEQRPDVQPGTTLVDFDRTPEELRRQVEGFIDAIDAYLAEAE